ncbi:cation-transporting ATPase [Microbacterium sp. 179-I 3D2 NHS]|uniref:cation-transporting ATPase n=1 Tax=Microbacterium sp. 179-I 3D2 NHS TaxID=3235178 RepID=UPI0039A10346
MGKLSRLIGLATEALDKNSGAGSRSSRDAGATDWGGMLRGAVDGVRGIPGSSPRGERPRSRATDADRAAIARYDYLLQTADPQRVEQMHREAFARLTPQQRALIEERMRAELTPGEAPRSASPDDLARAAGRTEAMNPGRMRGLLSRVRGGGGDARGGGAAAVAGGAAVGILGAVAGGAVLSAVAAPLLAQAADLGVDFTALAEGIDLDALASGVDVDAIAGGAEGVLGSVGESVSGLGETATGWGERLGDLGVPGIGDLFGR